MYWISQIILRFGEKVPAHKAAAAPADRGNCVTETDSAHSQRPYDWTFSALPVRSNYVPCALSASTIRSYSLLCAAMAPVLLLVWATRFGAHCDPVLHPLNRSRRPYCSLNFLSRSYFQVAVGAPGYIRCDRATTCKGCVASLHMTSIYVLSEGRSVFNCTSLQLEAGEARSHPSLTSFIFLSNCGSSGDEPWTLCSVDGLSIHWATPASHECLKARILSVCMYVCMYVSGGSTGGGGLGGLNPPPPPLGCQVKIYVQTHTVCSYSTLSQAQPQTI